MFQNSHEAQLDMKFNVIEDSIGALCWRKYWSNMQPRKWTQVISKWWWNGVENIIEMGTGSSLCMQCHGVVFARQPKGQSVYIGYFLYLTYGQLEGVNFE